MHEHGNWVSKINHHSRYYLVTIINLVEEARYYTKSVSNILPWDLAIYDVGLDDKDGIPVGHDYHHIDGMEELVGVSTFISYFISVEDIVLKKVLT